MKNRNCPAKLIFILLFIFLIKLVFAETEGAKLRWEYKYQEGDILMYMAKGRDIASGSYDREVEAVLGIRIGPDIGNSRKKGSTWTQLIKLGEENKGFIGSNTFSEGITGKIEIDRDGSVEGLSYFDVFHLSLPRFSESGLDVWNKEIQVNEPIGQQAGARIKLTGYYRKLVGEEGIKGRRCIIIETEIGTKADGTDLERGSFMRTVGPAKLRMKLNAKSWFDTLSGRVIKMESDLKIFDVKEIDLYANALRMREIVEDRKLFATEEEQKKKKKELDEQIADMKKTGKKIERHEGESICMEFSYELLDEKEIKKLDGIEDEWELVMNDQINPWGGILFNVITADGKLVFTREEKIKEKTEDGKEKEIIKNYIWICDGDGKNRRKIVEGTRPVVSPDGRWIAFTGGDGKINVIDKHSGQENTEMTGMISPYSNGPSWLFNWKSLKSKTSKNLPGAQAWWGDKHKKVILTDALLTTKGRNFYMYDIEKDKLYNMPELSELKIEKIYLSSKDLVIACDIWKIEGNEGWLLYLSDDGKILRKEEMPPHSYLFGGWSLDGNYLVVFGPKNYIYSLRSQKIIWEGSISVPKYGRFSFSPDFKYAYFGHKGALTKRDVLYRISTPKDLQEKIAKGE